MSLGLFRYHFRKSARILTRQFFCLRLPSPFPDQALDYLVEAQEAVERAVRVQSFPINAGVLTKFVQKKGVRSTHQVHLKMRRDSTQEAHVGR